MKETIVKSVVLLALLSAICIDAIDIDVRDNPIPPNEVVEVKEVVIEESLLDKEPEIIEEVVEIPVEVPEIEEEPIEVPVSAYTYTDEELDLLARLIYSESGTESYITKLCVGSVVMNRVDDNNFPNTIREVIYQKNQFSVTTIKKDGVAMIDRPADMESKKAALEILTYGSILPQKVQVFYHKSITSGWVSTREPYDTIDSTTFAYIYKKGEK